MLQTYSTTAVARTARVAYWNDLHWKLFLPIEVRPVDHAELDASLSFGPLGPISFSVVSSSPVTVDHSAQHVECTTDRWFCLMMALDGEIHLSQYGREIVLRGGDFVIYDSLTPCRMWFQDRNRVLSLRLAPAVIETYIPVPEGICGVKMSGDRGLGRLLAGMLPSLWTQIGDGVPDDVGPMLAAGLLDVVAAAYAMEQGTITSDSAAKIVRKAAIRRCVETRLRDPELSVAAVAAQRGRLGAVRASVVRERGRAALSLHSAAPARGGGVSVAQPLVAQSDHHDGRARLRLREHRTLLARVPRALRGESARISRAARMMFRFQ